MKEFDEYLKEGLIRKQHIDIPRAHSLMDEARQRMAFLEELKSKIVLAESNANYYIQLAYDIIMAYVRAIMLLDGYSSSSSHEAEIAYLKVLGFRGSDIRFMDDLRYYRNSILYYGKQYDVDYATRVLALLERIYPALQRYRRL